MANVSLNAVATFIKVAEYMSFSKASVALRVTPSVVSKRVSALEHDLGVQLLHRSTRRIQLTDSGRQLLDEVGGPLERVESAVEQLRHRGGRVSGELMVIVPSYFMGPELYDQVIPSFLAQYPECELRLKVVDAPLERLAEPFDLLFAGRLPERKIGDSPMIMRQLVRLRGAVYAAPEYLLEAGEPQRPEDVLEHRCLNYLTRKWRFVSPDGEVQVIEPNGPISTNSTETLKALVCRGMGLVYSLPAFFVDEVKRGLVREVLTEFTEGSYLEMNIFYPKQARMPARTRAFVDLLQAHYAASERP